ncbi:NAD(P)-dependent alcohol dehydrogenase [Paramicrobacterium fandaimingii]|uniref:NAD(P)-dependent alcohol dehydrogenase n=1 Tax=Paramicrobacterium fandaimingii TaxID=2708079 RepID=UPI001F308471|nr:NAD(P)-dependent alcohol dehydrogenase [Microbacterium fandaimingii]
MRRALPMNQSMRVAVHDRYGPPDVLHISTAPRPAPGSGQVLVRVRASTVNGGEVIGRQGRLKLITGRRFPRQIGIDFSGEIVALGADVSKFEIGDAVWGAVDERGDAGAAAEYVAVDVTQLSLAPAHLTPIEASTLLAGGNTALVALRDTVSLAPGERVLIRGAAGGVGSVAVQVAKMLGAHVTGLASLATADFVRSLGADEVVDYNTPPDELGDFDVVFDTRGTRLRDFRRHLARGGRMITIAFDIDRPVRSLGYIAFSVIHASRRVRLFLGHPNGVLFATLAQAADAGHLKPVVDSVFPLERIAEAHARLERGGVRGKVVIDVGEPR